MNGLAGLVVGAAAYDFAAARFGWETISTGFRRVYRHGWGRLVVGAAIGALALHLSEGGA